MNQLTPAQKIIKARNKLLLQNPFFGVLALKLQVVEDHSCPTAWVNGSQLGYNPDWIKTLPDSQVKGLIAHEVMHCVFKHPYRRKGRDKRKWNEANDHVINLILLDEGFDLPPDGLWDKQYKNMSSDHVYTLLPDQPKGKPPPGWDECRDGRVKTKAEKDEAEREWTIATRQAAQAAKQAGNLPGNLKDLIDQIVNPKVPWREVLRNFMSRPNKNDYSMTKPNRRFISSGLYLPCLYSEGIGDVVITVDTSGSISREELIEFQSEINCILEDTQPEKVYILYCDTVVHKDVDEFTFDDLPLELTMRGGGGTDFTEPFKWMEEQQIFPDVFVYFTDLCGSCQANDPGCPVLWLTTTDREDVPFGDVIFMNP